MPPKRALAVSARNNILEEEEEEEEEEGDEYVSTKVMQTMVPLIVEADRRGQGESANAYDGEESRSTAQAVN
jgi:hypothetical protein